jgi:hypothetical protein
MTQAAWFLGSIAIITAFAACSSSGSNGFGGQTSAGGASTTSGSDTLSLSTTSAGTGGAAIVGCDPFTGTPCHLEAGMICDWDDHSASFACFPSADQTALCQDCSTTFCAAGLHCIYDTMKCAAYCCDDGDCGAGGRCDKGYLGDAKVGVCFSAAADAGQAAHEPACQAPAAPPSQGACATP